jgi:hypothetical protein
MDGDKKLLRVIDGEVLMSVKAHKVFVKKFGDVVPEIENNCIFVRNMRRAVRIDENMEILKTGTMIIIDNYKNIKNLRLSKGIIGHIDKKSTPLKLTSCTSSSIITKMAVSDTPFEFVECTPDKYVRYHPFTYGKGYIMVIVFLDGQVVEEKCENDEYAHEHSVYISRFARSFTLEANKWVEIMKFSQYTIALYRF